MVLSAMVSDGVWLIDDIHVGSFWSNMVELAPRNSEDTV